jgi:hypothetical protein
MFAANRCGRAKANIPPDRSAGPIFLDLSGGKTAARVEGSAVTSLKRDRTNYADDELETRPVIRTTKQSILSFRAGALHLERRLPTSDLIAALRPCGLQNTPPGAAMLGAAARVRGLSQKAWTEASERKKSLVELWAMRGSPIVIAADDLPYFSTGLSPDSEREILHGMGGALEPLAASGISATELLERLCERAVDVLDGRALTKREFGEALTPAIPETLRKRLARTRPPGGDDPLVFFTLSAARLISLRGIFVMAPRETGKEPTLVRSDQWLEGKLPAVAAIDARAELVRRFLSSFAPATSQDLAWWANTQTGPAARRAVEAYAARIWHLVQEEITQVERPDGSVAFVLTDDVDRLADPPKVIGVRLIPPHDPLLMARDRDNIVSRQYHIRLWRSTHNPGVILGSTGVIATWTARKQARHLNITIEPLGSAIDRRTRDAIADEADVIAELRGCDDARLEVAS